MNLTHISSMPPDETAALMLITGDQYLLRYRDKGGAVAYKFVSPAAVRAAFVHETIDTGWLADGVRRWGVGKQGEWLLVTHRPQVYTFTFAALHANETVTLKVPMPGLAFFGCGQHYYVWAYADRELNSNSRLMAAPLSNIDGNGAVCFGQNMLPQASAKTMEKAWNIFLTSPFSNHSVNGKSRAFPDDVRLQLQKLALAGKQRYPLRDLVPLHQTADQMIDSIVRGIRA